MRCDCHNHEKGGNRRGNVLIIAGENGVTQDRLAEERGASACSIIAIMAVARERCDVSVLRICESCSQLSDLLKLEFKEL